jgi:hypothetical protein
VRKLILFLTAVLFVQLYAGLQEAQAQNFFARLFKNKLGVEIKDAEITLNQTDTTILIPYELKGFKRRYYRTRLFYSNNAGNSYKGPLRALGGDIGDSLRPGNNKKIAWSFRQDNPYFDGKNISFKIEAIEIPKVATGGPGSALRSLLIPGWGDTKVRNGYNYGWITALTYACLSTGTYFYIRADQKYKDYNNRIANTEEKHKSLFNDARRSQNVAIGFLAAGGSIWAADVIGVYLRGLKNKRRIQAEKEKLEAEKEQTSSRIDWTPRIIPATDGRNGQLTLLWKF